MSRTPRKGATLIFQPRIRKGAFFEAAWRHGCRTFSVYNRTYISSTFSNPTDEYHAVTEHVAIWPVMGERQVEVSGPEAAAFVQYLTTRDMSRCAVGQCKYGLITDAAGGILADPILLRLAEDRFWLSTSDSDLELWAKGVAVHAPMQNLSIRDAEVSVIQVQGPKSPRLMAALFGDPVLDLRYFWLTQVDFEGHPLTISRTGWSGEFGYEIYLENAGQGDALFDALLAAGAACQALPGAVNHARRVESGILSWGIDMTPSETPYDVGLGRLVELEGTPVFVGRAALEAAKDRAPACALVGMRVAGDALAANEDPWPLRQNGREVGLLTSIAFSPRLESNIAIGRVAPDQSKPGTVLQADTWDGPREAKVTEMPFLPKRQQGNAREVMRADGA